MNAIGKQVGAVARIRQRMRHACRRAPVRSATRTLKPAAKAGTDHGWDHKAFVIGGAVKGGDFYGTRLSHKYGAPLPRRVGKAESDLPYVFPNIGAFSNTRLGFMT